MKNALIAVCIAFFIALALQGVQFMNAPVIEYNEGFKSGLVTRASDCNCLPGYIPSNTSGMKVLGKEGDTVNLQKPSLVRYGTDDKWIEKEVTTLNFQISNAFFGADPAGGILKYAKIVQETSDNYFCQSLADPTKIRKCY
jgi:hypothetical protein